MGRVLTNSTSFRYAIEATETAGSSGIGFLPGEDPDEGGPLPGSPVWKNIEPNSISTFGSTISKIARNPIRLRRSRLKGTISDLDSAFGYDGDVTRDSFLDYIEGFMFAKMSNVDLIFTGSITPSTSTYQVAPLTAEQAAKLQVSAGVNTMLFASGYLISENNGIKTLSTAASAADDVLTVNETLVVENAPSNAVVEIAGAELPDGEVVSFTIVPAVVDVSPRIGFLTFSTVTPSTLGLRVGQVIFIQFPGAAGSGYGRVRAIDGVLLTLDRLDVTLVTNPVVTGDVTRLYFGQLIQDVPSDDADFLERSFQVEAEYPGLAADGIASAYEYSKGNFCNTITINNSLSDKSVFSADFIGTDTDSPTETRKPSAVGALDPNGTEAFSTVSDFARLRITDIDEDGLTTDFKSIELTINNNVSPEKVLNNLGARFMNYGDFNVDLTTSVLFTDGNVIDRIRQNTTVSLDMYMKNGDGVLAFGIPSMTLGDGSKDLPVGETVLLNITGEAFEDTTTGASLNVSFLPVVP